MSSFPVLRVSNELHGVDSRCCAVRAMASSGRTRRSRPSDQHGSESAGAFHLGAGLPRHLGRPWAKVTSLVRLGLASSQRYRSAQRAVRSACAPPGTPSSPCPEPHPQHHADGQAHLERRGKPFRQHALARGSAAAVTRAEAVRVHGAPGWRSGCTCCMTTPCGAPCDSDQAGVAFAPCQQPGIVRRTSVS